jgi:SAM-dependent methyltransferase
MSDGQRADIDVAALVATIRQEIARRRADSRNGAGVPDPALRMRDVVGGLEAAEHLARVGTAVPDWPERGRLKRRLSRLAARVVMRLAVFITKEQREFNVAAVRVLREIVAGLRELDGGLRQTQASLAFLEDAYREDVAALDERLAARERPLDERLARLERSATESVERLAADLARVGADVARGAVRADDLDQRLLRLQTGIALQERRLDIFLEEARRRLPASFDDQQLRVLADGAAAAFDGFYAALEDRFRGDRDEIKERLRVYLPIIAEAGAGSVLDLGCGRGELLELLRDAGVTARGVDTNGRMLEQCRARGLDVVQADGLAHLRSLPDASLAAVVGVHIIEHLDFGTLLHVFDETVRVLRPRGVAIFETPNPANLLVGSCNFYQDPTHRRPIPSPLAQYVAEARGLCRVRIVPLHPYPEGSKLHGSELGERVSAHFYGPQDYVVIGYRA